MKRRPIAAHLGMTRREFIRAKAQLAREALRLFRNPSAETCADDLVTGAAFLPDHVVDQLRAAHRALELAYQHLRSEPC